MTPALLIATLTLFMSMSIKLDRSVLIKEQLHQYLVINYGPAFTKTTDAVMYGSYYNNTGVPGSTSTCETPYECDDVICKLFSLPEVKKVIIADKMPRINPCGTNNTDYLQRFLKYAPLESVQFYNNTLFYVDSQPLVLFSMVIIFIFSITIFFLISYNNNRSWLMRQVVSGILYITILSMGFFYIEALDNLNSLYSLHSETEHYRYLTTFNALFQIIVELAVVIFLTVTIWYDN
jgi:hypothetical protein